MFKSKKIIITIFILAVLIIVGLLVYFNREDSNIEYITEKAQIKDIQKTVSITGNLTSDTTVNLSFEVTGRLKSVKKIGDKILENEAIANLDDYNLNEQVKKAEIALEKARAEVGINNDKIEEVDQTVSNAKKYLEKTEELEKQKVDAAQESYNDACDYYEDASSYYDKVVEEEGENSSSAKYAKLTLTTALNNKNSAYQSWQTAKDTQDLNIASAENSYKLAKDQRRTVESDFAKKSTNSLVETAQVNYNLAIDDLEKAELKSPINGEITKINYEVGEVIGSSSAGHYFGEIMSYDFILEADVPESDITLVQKDQIAQIVFDSLSENDKFSAQIIEIEPASTVIQDVVYYKIKLKLNEVDARLKPGMSADVDIMIDEKDDVLVVPQRAVEDNKIKILTHNNQVEERQVETGLKSDSGEVEIISGIKEGEEIILSKKE